MVDNYSVLEVIGLITVAVVVIGLLCWGSGYWRGESDPTLKTATAREQERRDAEDRERKRRRRGGRKG